MVAIPWWLVPFDTEHTGLLPCLLRSAGRVHAYLCAVVHSEQYRCKVCWNLVVFVFFCISRRVFFVTLYDFLRLSSFLRQMIERAD